MGIVGDRVVRIVRHRIHAHSRPFASRSERGFSERIPCRREVREFRKTSLTPKLASQHVTAEGRPELTAADNGPIITEAILLLGPEPFPPNLDLSSNVAGSSVFENCQIELRRFGPWPWSTKPSWIDILVNGGESAKSPNRSGIRGCSRWLTPTKVQKVIIANSTACERKNLCTLLKRFERRGVALVADSTTRRRGENFAVNQRVVCSSRVWRAKPTRNSHV